MTRNHSSELERVLYQTIVDGSFQIGLEETVSDLEVFSKDSNTTDSDALEVQIKSESILSKLDIGGQSKWKSRYQIEKELAPDTNSSVYLVSDSNLNRSVTVKVAMSDGGGINESAHRLIHEALIVSYFDHPGIPPVFDLELTENKQIYCTMKKVNGVPLSDIISSNSDDDSYIHTFNTVGKIVEIFIKLCEAIEYAHQHAVVHRNIKPEKIIVGSHGEVSIVGWDAAIDLVHDDQENLMLSGTPAYMSPEQAACAKVDVRADVFSIGATLFHILFKRPYLQRDDFDSYWQAKLEGEVDPLSEEQQRSMPPALVDMCMRSLQKDPDRRFQTVSDLLDALRDFQESDRIIDSRPAYVLKSLFIAVILLVCFVIAWQPTFPWEQPKDLWGEPIILETFDVSGEKQSNWQQYFEVYEGSFAHEDDRLRTQDGPSFCLIYKERLNGPVAIEFDGQMLPGSQAGDLSVFFSPDIHAEKHGKGMLRYYLQNGAYDNEGSTIVSPQGRLDFEPFKLEHGVTYRIRAEIDGKRLRLYVDGALKCSYDLIFPLNSGYIGIYAFYNDKIIDNVAVYKKSLPEKPVAVQIADALLENEVNSDALIRYESALKNVGIDKKLEQDLLFKIGLCKYNIGQLDQAFDVWNQVNDREYQSAINFYKWELLSRQGAYDELLKQMYYKHRSPDELVQKNIRHQWSVFLHRLATVGDEDMIREFINFRQVNFPESRLFSKNILEGLIIIGESERALEMFPEQDLIVVRALMEMGQYDLIISEYPQMRSNVATALVWSGRYQEVIDSFSDMKEPTYDAMLALEQFEAIEKRFANDEEYLTRLARARGKYVGDEPELKAAHYVFDRKLTAVLKKYFEKNAGIKEVESVVATADGFTKQSVSRCIPVHLMCDILAHLEGRPEVLRQSLNKIWKEKPQMMGMRLWYGVGVILGKIDRVGFYNQPRKHACVGDFYLYSALREDLYGDKAEAVKAYRNYLQTPHYKSYYHSALGVFAEGRLAALQ